MKMMPLFDCQASPISGEKSELGEKASFVAILL